MSFINCILFKGLTEDEVKTTLDLSESKRFDYKKDSCIFERDDIPEYMYVLISGAVQIEKVDVNGKRIIMNVFREEGTIFGEVYLYLSHHSYDYSCIAIEKSEVLAIPKSFFDANNGSNEILRKITYNMLEILSEKAYHLNQKVLILGSFSLRQKLSNFLLQKSRDSGTIQLGFNREELADYIGTTRPSLSRELMNMENDGLIRVEKDVIVIIDMERLAEIS
ncbi:Crp/Fnr family transcriptional regulator [Clostridioides mangenotii]|uniref:Crp/Fnr family transcriptional regulator n=1 Tax=Metaclostridioides mangenotii TaxID=1540 RepID=UPI001C128AA1|nr:Crp/Fnr family transcriptional regulator [Clostridioides mangenotii]